MKRCCASLLVVWGLCGIAAAQQPVVPAAPQPGILGAQPALQPPPPTPLEAQKHVVVTWTLGSQDWDFRDVEATFIPISGLLDLEHHESLWTFELGRDMLPGDLILHRETEGSPLKVTLLDADRVALNVNVIVTFATSNTGKKGDRFKVVFTLALPPDEAAKVMRLTKHVRVERRTKVGFESPQKIAPQ